MGKVSDVEWANAKKRCRLSAEDLRMAKELGFNPRTLIRSIPSPSQQWKLPVRDWIRDLYEKKHPGSWLRSAQAPNQRERPVVAPPGSRQKPPRPGRTLGSEKAVRPGAEPAMPWESDHEVAPIDLDLDPDDDVPFQLPSRRPTT